MALRGDHNADVVRAAKTDADAFLTRQGTVFQVMRFSVKDGPGIRTTVFLKGCPLRCAWCHNPESQLPEPEVVFREERCVRCGACRSLRSPEEKAAACPAEAREVIGRATSVAQVIAQVLRDVPFFDESGGGVTFSGGEPLMQPEFLEGLLAVAHEQGLHTAVDTCGLAPTETVLALAERVDLWLYDLKAIDPVRHEEFTGQPNGLILTNLDALARRGAKVQVRLPLVPGYNDDDENLAQTAAFLRERGLRQVSVLPYHAAADAKYSRLKRQNPMGELRDCPPERAKAAAALLRAAGLDVRIGS